MQSSLQKPSMHTTVPHRTIRSRQPAVYYGYLSVHSLPCRIDALFLSSAGSLGHRLLRPACRRSPASSSDCPSPPRDSLFACSNLEIFFLNPYKLCHPSAVRSTRLAGGRGPCGPVAVLWRHLPLNNCPNRPLRERNGRPTLKRPKLPKMITQLMSWQSKMLRTFGDSWEITVWKHGYLN
ncbi:hypothetical protein BGZ63DRAFT_374633 [Mariannaea sp. PMI_226]|nr:hypothetical protein BGZ63DRAFT_374633 [Mariannaea sp. PMI_226]